MCDCIGDRMCDVSIGEIQRGLIMDNNYLQKANEQLNKELRVGSENNAGLMRERIPEVKSELYDTNFIRNDIKEIEELLQNKEHTLTAKQLAELEAVQGRNVSTLLIMSEKTVGDSKKMKAVKKGIAEIERYLHNERNRPFMPDDMEYLLGMYDKAILACNDYLDHKSPTFGTGKDRYRQVQYNMSRLMTEASNFRVAQELLRSGVLAGEKNSARTAHDLMVQAKLYKLMPGRAEDAVPQAMKQATDAQVSELGTYGEILFTALSGKEDPADLIARLEKSDNDKELIFAQKLPALLRSIVSMLRDFKEYKASARMFVYENSVISLTQNAAGQMRLSVGGKSVPIGRNTGVLVDQLALNIVKNEKTYGAKAVEDIMQPIVKAGDAEFLEGLTGNMQLITSYLSAKTGFAPSKFNNAKPQELRLWLDRAFKGYIKELKDLLGLAVSNNVDADEMINGVETKELLKETQKEEKREDVEQKVTIEKQEAKQDKDEWEENEKKIMNMISDLIFSYETWTADEKINSPGERIKQVLIKNADALCILIADMYKKGEDHLKIINDIEKRLPLFILEDEEQIAEFKNMVAESVTGIMHAIDAKIAEKSAEMLPTVLEKREEIAAKKLLRAQKKEEKKQPSAGGIFGGGLFGALGNLINKGVDQLEEMVDNQMDAKLQKVDTAEKIYTIAVNHLADPQALKKGGGEFSLPSVFDIIRDLPAEQLAEVEQKIDGGIEDVTDLIQETVSKYSGALFNANGQRKAEEALPDPNAKGLKDWEKRNAQRKLIKKGNDMLEKKIKECLASGESGQGMFTKYVFDTYFGMVATMDKRSMIASMIRNSKPVTEDFKDENEPGITEKVKNERIAHNNSIRARAMGNYLGGMLKGAGPLFQKMMQGLPTEGLPEELKGAVEDMKSKLSPIPDEVVEAQLYAIVKRSHNQIKNIKVVKPLGAASVGQTFLCKLTKADGTEEEVAIKLLKPDVRNRMMREKDVMLFCARQTDKDSRTKENKRREKENEIRQQQGRKKMALLPEIKDDEKGGMQMTYEGQLERIEEELDLTIEARNVELGKVYDKFSDEKSSKAVSMKLNSIVAPTTNSMVLEKAPGETVDTLLARIRKEADEVMDLYFQKDSDGKVIMEEDEDGKKQPVLFESMRGAMAQTKLEKDSEEYNRLLMKYDPKYIIESLYDKLEELQKKKAYLDAYTKKWVEEGIFKEGFYHGDPHAGNIMISDEKLTAIDFGNCTKLSDEQQVHVTRMLFAASVGDMETFRSGFHALLNPRFESLYQEKRAELGRIITETFALGDVNSAGARIMVALLRAQELGLEVPAAVYNFSQGQMRLQNAISDFNGAIDHVKKLLEHISAIDSVYGSGFDFTEQHKDSIHNQQYDQNTQRNMSAYGEEVINFSSSRKTLAKFAYAYPNQFGTTVKESLGAAEEALDGYIDLLRTKGKKINKMSKRSRQAGAINTVIGELKRIKLYAADERVEQGEAKRADRAQKINKLFEQINEFVTEEEKEGIRYAIENIATDNSQDQIFDRLITQVSNKMREVTTQPDPGFEQEEWNGLVVWRDELIFLPEGLRDIIGREAADKLRNDLENGSMDDAAVDRMLETLEQKKASVNAIKSKIDRLVRKWEDIKKAHKDRFKPTDEEQVEYMTILLDTIDSYLPIQKVKARNHPRYDYSCERLTDRSNRENIERDMERFFGLHEYRKEEFIQAFNAFKNAQDSGLVNTDPGEYNRIEKELKDIYYDMMQKRINEKYLKAYEISGYSQVNFAEIMSHVIDEQRGSSFWRLGLYKSVKYKIIVDQLEKKGNELSNTEEDDKALAEAAAVKNAGAKNA